MLRPLPYALDAFHRTAAPDDGLLCTGTHKGMEVLPDAWKRESGSSRP
jgi:hypothetical protein